MTNDKKILYNLIKDAISVATKDVTERLENFYGIESIEDYDNELNVFSPGWPETVLTNARCLNNSIIGRDDAASRRHLLLLVAADLLKQFPDWYFTGNAPVLHKNGCQDIFGDTPLLTAVEQVQDAVDFFTQDLFDCPLLTPDEAADADADTWEKDSDFRGIWYGSRWRCSKHGLMLEIEKFPGATKFTGGGLSNQELIDLNDQQRVFLSNLQDLANFLPKFYFTQQVENVDVRTLSLNTMLKIAKAVGENAAWLAPLLDVEEEIVVNKETSGGQITIRNEGILSELPSITFLPSTGFCECKLSTLMTTGCKCGKN